MPPCRSGHNILTRRQNLDISNFWKKLLLYRFHFKARIDFKFKWPIRNFNILWLNRIFRMYLKIPAIKNSVLRSVLTSEIVVMAPFSQRNLKWECLDFTDGTSTDAIVGISAVVSSFLLTLYNRKPFWEDSSLAGDFLIKQGLTFYYVQYYGSSRGREFSSSTVVIIQFNLFLFMKNGY